MKMRFSIMNESRRKKLADIENILKITERKFSIEKDSSFPMDYTGYKIILIN